MASTGSQIIFLDHFKHPPSEGENQDMVRFPSDAPFQVEEIRVVPKGFHVKGPTKVIIGFNFQEASTHRFVPNARFPTDAVVVRGKYQGLTLAVLGVPGTPVSSSPTASPIHSIQKKGSPPTLAPIFLQPAQPRIPVVPKSTNILASPTSGVKGSSPSRVPSVTTTPGAPIPTIGRSTGSHMILPPQQHLQTVTTTLPAAFNPTIPPPTVSGISPGQGMVGGMYPPTPTPPPTSGVFFDPTRPPPVVVPAPKPPAAVVTSATSTAIPAPAPVIAESSSTGRREKSKRERKERDDRSKGSSGSREKDEGRGKRGRSEERRERRRDNRSSERRHRDRKGGSLSRTIKKDLKEEPSLEEEGKQSEAGSQEKFDLENISDEEFEYNMDGGGEVELTAADEEMLAESTAGFDPYTFHLKELKYFSAPWKCERGESEGEGWKALKDALSNPTLVNEYQDAGAEWVSGMESLEKHLPEGLDVFLNKSKKETVEQGLEILMSWVTFGLDIEEAKMAQSQPGNIIKHQKRGIILSTTLALYSREMTARMLEFDVQHRLLDLLEENKVVPSLVLQILKALEATTHYSPGMDAFLNQARPAHENGPLLTPYQRLSEFIKTAKNSRILIGAKALVRKISCHETLNSLKNIVDKLVSERAETEEDEEEEEEGSELSEEDGASAAGLLQNILFTYRNAEHLIIINRFMIPVSKLYEVRAPIENPYPALYEMMRSSCLLESLCVVCSGGNTGKRVVGVAKQLLDEIAGRMDGLLFFASLPSVSQNLIKILLQLQEGEGEEGSPLSQTGMDLVHYLQALQETDTLLRIRQDCLGDPHTYIDHREAVAALQHLMKLTFSPQGTRAVVSVLGRTKNLDAILPFVELTGDPEVDSRARKSACAAYAADLLLMTMRCSNSMELLQNFADRLLTVSSQDSFSRIGDLRNWVEVLRKLPNFSVASVEYLCDRINRFMEDGVTPQLPKGLIVVLRILKFLLDAPKPDAGVEFTEELKYRQALLKMYGGKHNTLAKLFELITKLVDSHLINWQQGLSMNNQDGQLFYACVLPALSIIRIALAQLIQVRKDEYQDLTTVRPLVHLFTVCTTLLPAQSVATPETKQIQTDVVEILVGFTQPMALVAPSAEGEEEKLPLGKGVEKSLWTRMVKEILAYREESPYAFVGATTLLTELLPVPLPMQCVEDLREKEWRMAMANRSAWSAHLEPVGKDLERLIRELVQTTHSGLLRTFRQLAIFLSDLTPHMARIVFRSILNSAISVMEVPPSSSKKVKEEEKKEESTKKDAETKATLKDKDAPPPPESKDVTLPVSWGVVRVLDMMSYLCSQPHCKMTVLSLIQSEKESDKEYKKLLPYFRKILTYTSINPAHNRSKECIVAMLYQFCDYDISLLGPMERSRSLQMLCWSLPWRGVLREICSIMLGHLSADTGFQITFVHILRSLLLTLDHDMGMDALREVISSEKGLLSTLLSEILNEFVKRKKNPSSDCCASLNLTMEFIKALLRTPEEEDEDEGGGLRTLTLDIETLRSVLGWKAGLEWGSGEHPLTKLASSLEHSIRDDETMGSYLEPVKEVIELLEGRVESGGSGGVGGEWREREWMECGGRWSLEELWAKRQTWMIVTEVEDEHYRLTPHYWFPSTPMEEVVEEQEAPETEPCDLEAVRTEFLPQFHPKEDLLLRVSAKHVQRPTKKHRNRPSAAIIDTSGKGKEKHMRPPLRGRGFIPRGQVAPRPNDPFRNRPQNTSRAPSMHVDDFLIMEIQSKAQDSAEKGRAERSGGGGNRPGSASRSLDRRGGRSKSPALGTIKERGGHRPNFGRGFHSGGGGQRRGGGGGGGRGGMRFNRNRDRDYRPSMSGSRYSHSQRRDGGRRSR